MIKELWGSFPRLIEQNINGLLDDAMPNPSKAFMLYKTCKNEDLWHENFQKFSARLEDFYTKPRASRRKSDFDQFLDRPMDQDLFSGFHLNFRTALINEKSIMDLASWTHNLIRVSQKMTGEVISLEIITQTLNTITNPGPFDKAENIEFEDFCSAWKKTVIKNHGLKHETEFNAIVTEMRLMNREMQALEQIEQMPLPALNITAREFNWIADVQMAALGDAFIPKFPGEPGFQKKRILELERVISLYEIVRVTKLPELLRHRESIRATLLDRCELLLSEKAG